MTQRLARLENVVVEVNIFSKNSKASFVIVRLPGLIVVLKGKDHHVLVPLADAV